MKTFVYLFKKKGEDKIFCDQIDEDSMDLVVHFFYRHHTAEWEIVQITLMS